jgi:hypothetical protein
MLEFESSEWLAYDCRLHDTLSFLPFSISICFTISPRPRECEMIWREPTGIHNCMESVYCPLVVLFLGFSDCDVISLAGVLRWAQKPQILLWFSFYMGCGSGKG